jgi:chemotaxis regulatin CheY-phosphate phosphatase CheZ
MEEAAIRALTPKKPGRKAKCFSDNDEAIDEINRLKRLLKKSDRDMLKLEAEKIRATKELDTARHALAYFVSDTKHTKKKIKENRLSKKL